ncbi:MAG: aminopeptidase P family protein [Erysipelotrichaceae bacterium]|nr:aminopeptidase P family protein [Erysipelotrichaceae bacterium]
MSVSNEHHFMSNPVHMNDLKTKIYSYREQERIRNGWLQKRLDTILPKVMKRSGIDLWVVLCKEYNEDPVLTTLVPCAMMTARRTTMLVYHLQHDDTVRRMAITRPGVGLDGYYESMWTNPKGYNWDNSKELMPDGSSVEKKTQPETQFECLNRVIRECNPNRIGINRSDEFAFADGLSSTLYEQFMDCLDDELQSKVCSAENICIGWLETRSEAEIAAYNGIMQIAHAMIDEAFSSRVITPGVTTNFDVKYFMMQESIKLGLIPWFDYEVSIRREGVGEIAEEAVILPGDLLHCDVGFRYLNLCTDTQENAYVLKLGETDAPEYLKDVMRTVNRLQDITISNFKEGRTGNEILAMSRKQAIDEGIEPCIYTHPIGNHGHAAGPTIGLWDMQGGVPVQGDYPMYNDTCYSLELNCRKEIKEWGITIAFGAETDVLFTNDTVYYLAGRQTEFHLVK